MPSTRVFDAIGTRWQIDILDACDEARVDIVMHDIERRIALFDATYSRFRNDSWVAQLAMAGGSHPLPSDAAPLLALYAELYRQTEGAFTPLIGNVLVDAGYDANYSLQSGALTAPPVWAKAIQLSDTSITLQKEQMLDFGAAGKGYLIDLINDVLRANNFSTYTIDAGGDMLHRTPDSNEQLRIGLEDPLDATCVIGVATIANQSLCGSAGNRRAWGDFHHIVDPHTLSSPRRIAATWVIAESTMLADALATCLFLTPPERLAASHKFEYLILYADRTVRQSPNFPVELFV